MSAVELKAGQMEAVQSSVSQLNHRLAFAAKRLDTVHGERVIYVSEWVSVCCTFNNLLFLCRAAVEKRSSVENQASYKMSRACGVREVQNHEWGIKYHC